MTAELQMWGWRSKETGTSNDYSVLDASHGGKDAEDARLQIERLHPGTPAPNSSTGQLPWVVFGSEGGSVLTYHICWWDWTGASDAEGRPNFAVLYLCLQAAEPLSFTHLARYARTQWQRHLADRGSVPAAPPPLAALPSPAALAEGTTRRWAAATAALVLQAPVRIDGSGDFAGRGPEEVSALFDTVAALLPSDVRATLRLTTGTVKSDNGPFHVAVGKPGSRTSVQVSFAGEPDLSSATAAAEYRDMLERMIRQFGTARVLDHLAKSRHLPTKTGVGTVREATAQLAAMDQLVAVGTALLQHRTVDPAAVLALVADNPLAGRITAEMQLAYLQHLLTHGGLAGLRLAAANWLPQANTLLTDVLAGHASTPDLDESWLTAAVELLRAAGADNILLPLLEREAFTATTARLIVVVVRAQLPADGVRGWLLQPAHETSAARIVRRGPDDAVPWFASAARPPAWLPLLRSATEGVRHPIAGPPDPQWLALAYEVCTGRYPMRQAMRVLGPDLASVAFKGQLTPRIIALLDKAPTGNATDRATCDFVLILSFTALVPGLRSHSAYAADIAYANELAVLASNSDAPVRAAFRDHLRRMLADPKATGDALVLLDHYSRTGGINSTTVVEDALFTVRARPDLLDRPGARELRQSVVDADPTLRETLSLSAVEHAAATKAAPDDFGALLVEAYRQGCDRKQLSRSLNRWAALADRGQLRELVTAAGTGPTDAVGWEATLAGLATIAPLLTDEQRSRLAATVQADVAAEADALDVQINALLRRRDVLAGVEELLGLPLGRPTTATRRRRWARLLRWLGLSAADDEQAPGSQEDRT